MTAQSGILAPLPVAGKYLFFDARSGTDLRAALAALVPLADGETLVVGIGASLVASLGTEIPGLATFPVLVGSGIEVPSTPAALWCWLRGDDRGDLLHRARGVEQALGDAFRCVGSVDAFRHGTGLDLTGYEDGTENPTGDDAEAAALVAGQGMGLDGDSFVAVQQWLHDFERFDSMSAADQDDAIGRRRSDNEELDEAPETAHVKRTAQESFDPEAFLVRRSMPWSDGQQGGLLFVAFGSSFDAFDAQLRRMVGLEDGISDALFRFTRPVSGGYFWCPPMVGGILDLSSLGV